MQKGSDLKNKKDEDNINILENTVRMRIKRGGERLSSLLPSVAK